MKSGAISKILGVDPKTITSWADRFTEFLSSSATPGLHRDFQQEDLNVFNTVLHLRANGLGWNDIKVQLEEGVRYLIDEGLVPAKEGKTGNAVVSSVHALIAARRIADLEVTVEQLRQETREKDRQIEEAMARKDEQMREERERANAEIRKLEREIGGLMVELKILKEQK